MNKNGKFLFLILTLLLLFISVGTISATDVDNTTVSDDMTLNTPSDVVLEKVITKASKQQNTEVAIVNKNKTQKQIKTDKQTKKTVETIQTANNYETLKTAWNNIQTDGDDTTEYTINVKNGNYTFTEELKSDNTSKTKYITLKGEDVDKTIFNGENKTRLFNFNNLNQIIKISKITFINGFSDSNGGALCSNATLNITDTKFINNSIKSNIMSISGGAVDCSNNLIIFNSSFINNSACLTTAEYNGKYLDSFGGALSFNQHTYDKRIYMNMSYCEFINNSNTNMSLRGGAIYVGNNATYANISYCEFTNNFVSDKIGTDIYFEFSSNPEITNCIFNSPYGESLTKYPVSSSNFYLRKPNTDLTLFVNDKLPTQMFNQNTDNITIKLYKKDKYYYYSDISDIVLGRNKTFTIKSSSNLLNTTGIVLSPENNYGTIIDISNLPAKHEDIKLYIEDFEVANIVSNYTNIKLDNITAKPGETIQIIAKITSNNNELIQDGRVAFKLNGCTIGHTNIKFGVAKLNYTIPDNYSAKDYKLSMVYGGNKYFMKDTSYANIHLNKIATTTDVKTIIDENTLKITVNPVDENNNTVKSGKICVKIEGKTLQNLKITGKTTVNFTIPKSWNNREIKVLAIYGENNNHKESRMEIKTKLVLPNTKTTKKDNTINNYYVSDQSGSDINTGSQSSPFKTIQKAINTVNTNKQSANIYLDGNFKGLGNTNLTVPGDLHINFIGVGNSSIDGEVNYTMGGDGYYWGSGKIWEPYEGTGNWGMNITHGNGLITISNFTIKNTWNPGPSSITGYNTSAVNNYGNLEVNNVTFYYNFGGVGASLRNQNGATLKVTNSLFEANRKSSSTGNTGVGVYNNGTCIIINSTFQKNYARWGSVTNDNNLTVINSIFRDNIGYDGASTYKAGTGIAINTGRHNFADVYDVFNIQTVIDGCTFINNDQADIHFDESTLNITNSKFSKSTGIFSMHKEKSYVYNNKTFNVINIVNNTFESPIPSTITVSLSTGSSKYMLYLYGPYTYHIENNTGSKLSCQAIESNMNDSVIKNNTFDDSLIILGNNNIICDNKITTKQMYAINISDTSKNNNITNNYLKSSLFEGDGAVPYTSSINTVINNTPKSSLILINNENFYKYFNDDGELRLEYTDIEKVSLIDTLNNKDIIINQDLTITQQSTNIVSCNITITTRPNTVVEITGLKVKNTNNRPIVILNSDNNIITKSNFTTNNTNTVVINNTKLNNISNNYLIADILVGDESVTSVNENMITSNTPLYQNCIISDETYNQYFNNDGTIKTLDDREIYILIGDLNNKTLILNNNRTIQITNYHTIVPHNITIKTENNTKINMQNITIENTNNKAILEIRSQDNTIENTNLISNNNIILVENATNFKLSANNLKTNCTNSVKTIIIRNSTVLIIDNNITTIGCANENIENTTIAIDSYDSKLHIEHNNILTSYSTINGVNNIIYSINMINPEGSLKTNEITRNTIITTGSNKAYSINYVNQKGYISYSNITTNAKSNIALNIISSTITGSINYMRILSSTSNSTGIVIDSCENIVLDRNMINLVGENVKGIIVVNVSNINITDSNITLEGTNSVAINLMNVNQSELSSNKIISRTTSDVTPILLNNTNENYITANSVSSTSTYSIKTVNTTNSIIYLNQLYASTLGDESIEIQNINNIKIIENTPEQSFKNLILTDKTYNNFFDENGHLRDEVPYGVSIELRGVIYNKILNITRPINIIGTYMSGFKNTTIFIDAKAKNTNITNMNLEGYENTKLIVNANNCNINIPLVNVENIIEDTTLITINGNYNNITIENITSKNTNTNPVNLIAIHIKGYKNNINITEIKLQNYTKSSGIILSNSNNNEIELNKITSTNHILLNNSNNNYVKFIELNNDATHQCIALHLVNSSNNIISADQIKFTTPVDGNKAVLVENNSNYNKFFKINLGAYTYLNIPISILNSSYNLITGGNLVCKGKIYPMEIIDGIENSVKNNKISSDIISANKAVYQESTIYETVDNPVYENMNGTSIIPVIIQLNVSSEVKIHETITIQVRITVGAITKGNVTFYINGEAIGTSKIVSKRASINYTVTGQEGDKLYIEAIVIDEANKNVPTKYLRFINPTIIKLDSNIILPNVVSENGKTTFTALIRDEEGNIQTTGKVAFKLNGKTYGVVNIENGIAQLTVDSSKLSAKNYTITAVYGGNTMTEKSTQNATLTITKSTPKIQMPTTTKRTNNTQITINLTDENGNKINSNQKVCIKFNGCTIINTKAENGTVKVNLDLTQYRNSQYDFTVVCGENSLYNTSRLTSTLIIE